MESENHAPDDVCEALLRHVFGDLTELMNHVAPQGWAQSPYLLIHHPTAEQRHAELAVMYENLNRLRSRRKPDQPAAKPLTIPTLDELRLKQANESDPIDPLYELLNVYGGCVWSVFSNNHDVVGPTGEVYHLGSFRGTGSFLSRFIEQTYPDEPPFDYMDFYCADLFIERRANVTPIYELIFRRLNEQGCDWVYSFPRMHLISVDHLKGDAPTDPATYDPNKALAEEDERAQRREETRKLQDELDRAIKEEMEEARYKAPPMLVQAYYNVYGQFPEGWVNEG